MKLPKVKISKLRKLPSIILTLFFYFSIGFAASLLLAVGLYRVLRIDSTISTFFASTYGNTVYFWTYVVLTFLIVILFGVNAALFAYRLRKYGLPPVKNQSGVGFGSIFAIFSSACPVCGSTLLSAIGMTGGLAALPFGGLELKSLSLALVALPVFLTARDIKNKGCTNGVCPVPRNAVFKKKDVIWLANIFLVIVLTSIVGWNMLKYEPLVVNAFYPPTEPGQENSKYAALQKETQDKLFPKEGIRTQIFTGNTIVKMVSLGVIDIDKLQKQYKDHGGIPDYVMDMLTKPKTEPLIITQDNAQWLVTILWPLGLSNKMEVNKTSPMVGKTLFSFASTGGWTLGRENGGFYFNKYDLIPLTPDQEARVKTISNGIFRPCCNNSAFFQDCNHGSAALGLVELGVSQGLSDEEIYKNVLAFNSFWFAQSYLETALYFKEIKGQEWESLDPKMLLSADYSSAGGWAKSVHSEVAKIPGLVPNVGGGSGSSCSN